MFSLAPVNKNIDFHSHPLSVSRLKVPRFDKYVTEIFSPESFHLSFTDL